jgi:ATP-dependent HslUV protease subunit HslV
MTADSRGYSGGKTHLGQKSKLYPVIAGGCVGVSSTQPGFGERFAAWMNDGAQEDKFPKAPEGVSLTALFVNGRGEVFVFENSPFPTGPLKGDYFAIGTGAEYAFGAMAMGADAAQAIAVAKIFDVWSAGDIMIMDLRTPQQRAIGSAVEEAMEVAES